jgi:hypothetical protein
LVNWSYEKERYRLNSEDIQELPQYICRAEPWGNSFVTYVVEEDLITVAELKHGVKAVKEFAQTEVDFFPGVDFFAGDARELERAGKISIE